MNQKDKAAQFKSLHEGPGTFVIPNPFDAGTARMLTRLGFKALATTSAGAAFAMGRQEGAPGRAEHLAHARAIAGATHLPVSGDLENGFANAPEACAQTILLAAEAGLVGGSIEDRTGRADDPLHTFDDAVARVRAAVAAARKLGFPFTLTARTENFLCGRPDIDDTVRRLAAFAEAGADVLYAPGLRTPEQIAAVVRGVAPKPVNVIIGPGHSELTVAELARLGVRRISVGSGLARIAYGAFLRAARELAGPGTYGLAREAASFAEIEGLLRPERS